MIPSYVFGYMVFYVIFFLLLGLLATYGLNQYIASEININPPSFSSYTCNDSLCALYYYLLYFGQNIAFLFTLIFANPFSSFAFVGWFFTGLTVIFGMCIILFIRG